MKICYITNLYPPHVRGGAERIVARLAREAQLHGHEVHIITSAPWKDVQFAEHVTDEQGIFVHRIFHWSLFFNLSSGEYPAAFRFLNVVWSCVNFMFTWRVVRILRRVRPDIVHTHNLAGTSFLVPVAVRVLNIRHIHTLHDIQLSIASGRMTVGDEYDWVHAGFLARGFQALQQALWGSPDVVTAPSEWLLAYYKSKKYFQYSRLQVVRHYFGAPVAGRTDFPQAHITREKFTMLYVGQMERAKGILMIINAFSELYSRSEMPEVELILVGSGEDLKSAEILASVCPAIRVVGETDSSRVAHMMRAADVVVVPSLLYENSPTVVIEALSLGRPVSVSDIGGAAELVKKFDGGWVVAPTESAWRAHLLWLSKNRDSVVQKVPLVQLPNAAAEFEKIYVTH
jgi:glycosyltransferase involved in cell wall biosynthesis